MTTNILFIIVDDLNSWIGVLGGHPQAHTPNIDALAQRGVLFVNAYCSASDCNASRMSVFTGKLPSTLGVYGNEPFWDAIDRPLTMMERLRACGYTTVGAGNVFHGIFNYEQALFERLDHAPWKEIENRALLWDEFHSNTIEPLPGGRPLNGLFDFSDPDEIPEEYRLFDWGPCEPDQEALLPDERSVVALERFLRAPGSTPFFCAAGLYKPHLPWYAPKRFFDVIGDEIILPPVKSDDLDDAPPIARELALDRPDHELVTSRGVWRDAVRGYLACIAYADYLVGRLLAALAQGPARDDTLIVLCGDNGFHLGEKSHWRKFALWEETTRVPLIYAPPGGPHRRITTPVSLVDIFPTIMHDVGLACEVGDGWSLNQTIAGLPQPVPVISTWGRGNHSIRSERWRYTLYADGGEELFDHASDPHEWTNLAGREEYSRVKIALRQEVERATSYEIARKPQPIFFGEGALSSKLELVSVHVPKTGGTSFLKTLRDHFRESLVIDHDHIPGTKANMNEPVMLPAHARAVHGHFRGDRYLHFVDAFQVTFLRDPVEQVISNYYFWLTHPPSGHPTHERLLAERPSIVRYARHYLKGLLPGYFRGVDPDSFDYVGFTDRRFRDGRELSHILGFDVDLTIHENQTILPPDLAAERSEVETNARILSDLRDALRDDYYHYDRFRARWA